MGLEAYRYGKDLAVCTK